MEQAKTEQNDLDVVIESCSICIMLNSSGSSAAFGSFDIVHYLNAQNRKSFLKAFGNAELVQGYSTTCLIES